MILALQCHPGDADQALELVKLICDIEPERRSDVEFCISHRRGTDLQLVELMSMYAAQKFEKRHTIQGMGFATGWPNGSNQLWTETMMRCHILYREGKTKSKSVLTFEPDCLPMRKDWLNELFKEEKQMLGNEKMCRGHIVEEGKRHINGNAIFDIGIMKRYSQLHSAGNSGWDWFHAELLLSIGEDTPVINQIYNRLAIETEELEALGKTGIALLHGIKDRSGISKMRSVLRI